MVLPPSSGAILTQAESSQAAVERKVHLLLVYNNGLETL